MYKSYRNDSISSFNPSICKRWFSYQSSNVVTKSTVVFFAKSESQRSLDFCESNFKFLE